MFKSANISIEDYFTMLFKKVLVLYVGGTIGMQRNKDGALSPVQNVFLEKLRNDTDMNDPFQKLNNDTKLELNQLVLPRVDGLDLIVYEIKEYNPLLDSSNMTCSDWKIIAEDIENHYEEFDGFLILQGTDTMAYTSSALSFMLDGLQKPVIVTGSQIPIFETRSDAKTNMISSMLIAACYEIPEVCLFFGEKLLRGNRATKISSNEIYAFDSPNYHTLADAGIHIKVNHQYIRYNKNNFSVTTNLNTNVSMFTFFPTVTCDMLETFLKPPVEGVIVQSYGAGNIPSIRTDIMDVFKKAVERGILVVNITQCSRGKVEAEYETGQILESIGIIAGEDLTVEAAVTKLSYVLGLQNLSYAEKAELMRTDIRGEMTTL